VLSGHIDTLTPEAGYALAAELRLEMQEAAVQMEYEKAAYLRDEITKLEQALERLPAGE